MFIFVYFLMHNVYSFHCSMSVILFFWLIQCHNDYIMIIMVIGLCSVVN